MELTIAGTYIRIISEVLTGSGGDRAGWLARNRLTNADLEAAELTLSMRAFSTLIESAVAMSRDPGLGLLVGARLAPAAHGLVGFAASSAPTLRSALEIMETFVTLRAPFLVIDEVAEGKLVNVRVRAAPALGAAREPLLEATTLAIVKLVRDVTLGAVRLRRVAFSFARPSHAALARQLFATDVRYRQTWTGVTLDARDVDRPLKLANLELHAEARRLCESTLARRSAGRGMTERLRELLLQQTTLSALPVAARLLGLAPRTLHRRLTAEGTSFRAVLESIRRELAREHLHAGVLSIGEIAHALGYTDISNFRRAFRRWEIVTPSRFRQARQGARRRRAS